MTLIAASWPSNSDAAVMNRYGVSLTGLSIGGLRRLGSVIM
jgi:hypothetical protein